MKLSLLQNHLWILIWLKVSVSPLTGKANNVCKWTKFKLCATSNRPYTKMYHRYAKSWCVLVAECYSQSPNKWCKPLKHFWVNLVCKTFDEPLHRFFKAFSKNSLGSFYSTPEIIIFYFKYVQTLIFDVIKFNLLNVLEVDNLGES